MFFFLTSVLLSRSSKETHHFGGNAGGAVIRVETKIFVFAFSRKYIFVFGENFTTKIDENNENFRENAFLSLSRTKLQFSNDF
jgi:hypothetical protein